MRMSRLQEQDSESAYIKDAGLKAKIADENMWSLIPGVEPDICGLDGARRMKQNELLFEFIDIEPACAA